MTTSAKQWPAELLPNALPALKPWLERIADHSAGEYTVESLVRDIANKQTALWVVWDHEKGAVIAAAITDVYIASSGEATAILRGIAWDDRRSCLEHLGDLEEWARQIGCTRLKALLPKKVAKHLPDYRMSHIMLEKPLTVEAVADAA